MFKSYILHNWILVLILSTFVIILATTAFLDKKATRRTYELIGFIFLLSITVFIEFWFEGDINYKWLRLVLMAIRYSATPIIIAGLYCAFLIYLLIRRSNKRAIEIIPICVLAVAFISGLVFPFIFGQSFSQIFCSTIAVAFFIYYVFSILQLTKKDGLTGLLNRQAYYAETSKSRKDITAIISSDMNGQRKSTIPMVMTLGTKR